MGGVVQKDVAFEAVARQQHLQGVLLDEQDVPPLVQQLLFEEDLGGVVVWSVGIAVFIFVVLVLLWGWLVLRCIWCSVVAFST